MFCDFAGFWALGLDMLPPSDSEGTLLLDVKHVHDVVQVCDVDKGYPILHKCEIEAEVIVKFFRLFFYILCNLK